jgi:hypothetical protein
MKKMIEAMLRILDIGVETMTREQAASWLLEREIRVLIRPLIVEPLDRVREAAAGDAACAEGS